jgi:predicted nucleic acid-binding protein
MLKASLEKSGNRLDDFDLTIASCALAHNLTLVTNNLKHFSRIEGLKIANWSAYPAKKLNEK